MELPSGEQQFMHTGNVLSRFREIHTFIFDVDGVMTDSQLLITEEGELLRRMNVRDGYALKQAVNAGYRVLVLTGGHSQGVVKRLKELGLRDIVWGTQNKLGAYEEYLDAFDVEEEGILYMGDDLPDVDVLRRVGFPTCPKDAVPEILQMAQYISPFNGGDGCVRDVIEKALRLQGKWK